MRYEFLNNTTPLGSILSIGVMGSRKTQLRLVSFCMKGNLILIRNFSFLHGKPLTRAASKEPAGRVGFLSLLSLASLLWTSRQAVSVMDMSRWRVLKQPHRWMSLPHSALARPAHDRLVKKGDLRCPPSLLTTHTTLSSPYSQNLDHPPNPPPPQPLSTSISMFLTCFRYKPTKT